LSGPAGQATIPPQQSSATITLSALADMRKERGENVKLILAPNPGYHLPKKAGKSAVIKITNVP
jgi:hypothetical protein